jgi:hypothetical protein
MATNAEVEADALRGCLWEMRTQVESELRELTEAQQRLDAFLRQPSDARRAVLLQDLHDRLKTLSRTNETVLGLIYDCSARISTLSDDAT